MASPSYRDLNYTTNTKRVLVKNYHGCTINYNGSTTMNSLIYFDKLIFFTRGRLEGTKGMKLWMYCNIWDIGAPTIYL